MVSQMITIHRILQYSMVRTGRTSRTKVPEKPDCPFCETHSISFATKDSEQTPVVLSAAQKLAGLEDGDLPLKGQTLISNRFHPDED